MGYTKSHGHLVAVHIGLLTRPLVVGLGGHRQQGAVVEDGLPEQVVGAVMAALPG